MNVNIKSDSTGFDTTVTASDGTKINGVRELTWSIGVDRLGEASIKLYTATDIDLNGRATFFVNGREVRRIEYADGTADEYPQAA